MTRLSPDTAAVEFVKLTVAGASIEVRAEPLIRAGLLEDHQVMLDMVEELATLVRLAYLAGESGIPLERFLENAQEYAALQRDE